MTHRKVASAIRESEAVLRGEFELSSGRTSDYYIDKYLFETKPDALRVIGRGIAAEIEKLDVDLIAAVALGGVPLAAVASVEAGIPYIIVRKEEKEYGTESAIEGEYSGEEKVVVVEDIITTGGSALNAIEQIRSAGLEVKDIIVVVDREEGGREALEDVDVDVISLVTAEDIK